VKVLLFVGTYFFFNNFPGHFLTGVAAPTL